MEPGADIPNHFFSGLDNRDSDEALSFEDFLLWTIQTAYVEDMVVVDERDREMRKIARLWGVPINEVEQARSAFDRADKDRSGTVELHEFGTILCSLMKVKDPSDVPDRTVQRIFREVDIDLDGSITFAEFLTWYSRMTRAARSSK
eukprot:CAMPEP_0176309668 /NCGR_PEP_ID=MMETSP0121_2-20121125/65197_1 /TAXON_ID=160619 /ORGANISM="Kryptoperidinium foliaceum, Strain CCMP 1326" /LENGTH=145 /DNA_ID=CAMNT_0017651577 /DNA_START=23 /DNA_END=460 /DNA_ORIENTATION=-